MAVDPPSVTISSSEGETSSSDSDFDIVSTYRNLLASDADLTMPVAAIEALVVALSQRPTSTISETLEHLSSLSATLIASAANPISLSAGTDLFQRYIASALNRPSGGGAAADFDALRRHLLANGRLFIERAKASRAKIARFGRHFVRDGCTVLTAGGSRVVGALLREAADARGGSVRFSVVYVLREVGKAHCEGADVVKALRDKGVPVATITEGAVAYSMGMADMVIVGAEGVVENGGIISRLGTYQLAVLAKSMGRPVYVVAESHKFVRLFPLGQYDLPIKQRVVEFKTTDDEGKPENDEERGKELETAVDFTPPELISGIVTESGVLTPSAVSEELIKIWF